MVVSFVIDKQNGGCYIHVSKRFCAICLFYFAIRFYIGSEDKWHKAITYAVVKEMEEEVSV